MAETLKKNVTTSKEDYLKAIWTLSERRAEQKSEASTRDLAEALQVSPPAVSRMLRQLEQQLLVAHTPYYGVRLTDKGRAVALKIVRRHRLIELFLTEILGYDAGAVHDEAERLEHHISDEFEQKIDKLLNFPEACPHGSIIPRPGKSSGR
jgi:DtxR family Mn-dependent transcriptional regulator